MKIILKENTDLLKQKSHKFEQDYLKKNKKMNF